MFLVATHRTMRTFGYHHSFSSLSDFTLALLGGLKLSSSRRWTPAAVMKK